MCAANHPETKLTEKFVFLATELSNHFPDLDLRFNLESGTNKLRFTVPQVGSDTYEVTIDPTRIELSIHEAIFTIKQITQRFDS